MVDMTLDEIVEYAAKERWAIRLQVPVASGAKTKIIELLKQKKIPMFEVDQNIVYSMAADAIASLPEDQRTVFVIGNLEDARSGSQRVVLDILTHQRPIIAVDHPKEKNTELSISIRTRFVHVAVDA